MSETLQESIQKYQTQLLDQIRRIHIQAPLSQAVEKAYLETPRHAFVSRYRERGSAEWHVIRTDTLRENLALLYAARPLILAGDDDQNILSTISEPSFVLRMLDMLQFQPGHRVFELGAGSGWNAALIGKLVGPTGQVTSLEIIPGLARQAAESIQALGIENVSILAGDGGEGYASGAPYDRAIFTAGSFDLPRHFYQQIGPDGLLLVVIKSEGGGDTLCLLRKVGDHFESIDSMQCGFVQMVGKYRIDDLDPIELEMLPGWENLKDRELSRTPFWWGGKGQDDFMWRTLGIRSFLGIAEPRFRAFKTRKSHEKPVEQVYFGLWDQPGGSLVLANDDQLIAYGTSAAKERLMQDLEQWLQLGMPTTSSLALQIYPVDFPLSASKHQWLLKRTESQFLWGLP